MRARRKRRVTGDEAMLNMLVSLVMFQVDRSEKIMGQGKKLRRERR